MSRRNRAPKRDILPDPKYKSQVVAKFVNHIMLSGKKSIAEKIVYGAFDKIKAKDASANEVEVLKKRWKVLAQWWKLSLVVLVVLHIKFL